MIYLNNAATSFPKPQSVIDAVFKCLQNPPCHSGRTGMEREDDDPAYLSRVNLAKLFNVPDPLHIIFTSGSTEALNLAINGLDLQGKHVVSTMIEHNSVVRPLTTKEVAGEIELTFVECNETTYISPEAIEAAIRPNTTLVIVNHCSNVTGTVLDLKEIGKVAHKHNCTFVVDASQSAGCVPIDFVDMDIDMLAFTGHKSLFGLQGIGGLCIKEGLDIKPLKVGGTGTFSEITVQPKGFPIYYEAGTPNVPGIISLLAGTQFIFDEGFEKINAHKKKLVKKMMDGLKDVPKIKIYTREEHNSYANFCFNVVGIVPEEVGYILESSFEITVRTGLHCAPFVLKPLGADPWGTVRVSPSYFTKDEDVDKFIDAVKEIANMFKS